MKFLMEGFKELNYKELLAVNGGCSGYCSVGYRSITKSTPVQTPSSYNATSYSYSGQCSTYMTTGSRINEAINKNMDKTTNPYISGKNDCDIWTEKVLKEAGFDISNVWGKAANMSVEDHEKMLAGKTTDNASYGWSVVLMTDSDKFTTNHCGIINVSKDGSVSFYQNTKSAGGPVLERYSSVNAFQKAYAYKDFDYFSVAN